MEAINSLQLTFTGWWAVLFVATTITLIVSACIVLVQSNKFRKRAKTYQAISESLTVDLIQRDEDRYKQFNRELATQERHYKGRISELNERVKNATDQNRCRSLELAIKNNPMDPIPAAKMYHRFLQGRAE